MKNFKKVCHILANVLCLVMIIGGLCRFIFTYKNLPEIVGVRFSGAGTYDMMVNKNEIGFLLYPHITSVILFMIFELLYHVVEKATVSNIKKKDEKDIKYAVSVILDYGLKLIWAFFLSVVWSESVINQVNLEINLIKVLFFLQTLTLLLLAVLLIVLLVKNKNSKKKA